MLALPRITRCQETQILRTLHTEILRTLHMGILRTLHMGMLRTLHMGILRTLHTEILRTLHTEIPRTRLFQETLGIQEPLGISIQEVLEVLPERVEQAALLVRGERDQVGVLATTEELLL
jgi:hypothetical protein